MITPTSRTKEWILAKKAENPGSDPILIEKMIMALFLLENLQISGLDFIFKGGTSLPLLIGQQHRFSIDIDIILPKAENLNDHFREIINNDIFSGVEENVRAGQLPKSHHKFFYQSSIHHRKDYVLLDILFETNPYPIIQPINLQSPLIQSEGTPTKIICPSKEGLLGDKLTAFAPNTTGIPYGINKELEIVKQLFDIAILFDVNEDLLITKNALLKIASQELIYRAKTHLSPDDVLIDTLLTSFMIGMKGSNANLEYSEILSGVKKMSSYVFNQFFSIDSAILCASKAAYLSSLLLTNKKNFKTYDKKYDISNWFIEKFNFNKLNKLKKTNPEAFYYFFKALETYNPSA
ncbi:MAG TPA: nucleotidyl transferase AbiEii/AbiGii toxin family protein [Anaerolineaceae bacterium]|nr:nucleotidyl transferase AbiEii/AbiGii toxin family protein [Anaerolineaceae bacterium]